MSTLDADNHSLLDKLRVKKVLFLAALSITCNLCSGVGNTRIGSQQTVMEYPLTTLHWQPLNHRVSQVLVIMVIQTAIN